MQAEQEDDTDKNHKHKISQLTERINELNKSIEQYNKQQKSISEETISILFIYFM